MTIKSGAMRVSGALRHIEHIATLDLGSHIAIPEMLRTLDGVVPGARTGFYWVDPSGAVLDAYVPNDGAGNTSDLQINLTIENRLRAILVTRRESRTLQFGERERRLFRAASPSLRRALVTDRSADERFDELPERTGTMVVSADGRLISADRQALLLSVEMDGRPLTEECMSVAMPGHRLAPFIADLCGRRAARGADRRPTLQKASRWGAYRARAFPQCSLDQCSVDTPQVVVITKHLPQRVRLMRVLEQMDLSPRERQVVFQLGMGADATVGAATLGVSISTWRSYVKRVYVRLDVRDRQDLFARLHGPATFSAPGILTY